MAGAPLHFHVPEPAVPPRRQARFLQCGDPEGRLGRRPPIDVDPEEIRDLAYSIIRVLNREGEAVGPWAGL